ncbi:hypothetical protein [Arthrobacter sp. ES1]|uniref:hypothetical protein n=1 Tax=Arthrobacter sp. ES1 TaxID=1897056 RepID=UPI001CFFD917|nr:hypothetical protein [Arthrobacter sp. ES1]MCB5280488.1 hypothetical protein [Arthrobacter sp. ES1]
MPLTITTELTIKPGAGQTQEQAEAEFVVLFREYLTTKDSAFQADYGPEPWGGYEGPTVASVTVRGPEEPAIAPLGQPG